MINSSQVIVAKYLYDPCGNTISMNGPLAEANLYRFSSKEAHRNSGMLYFGRRFYDPNFQRWLNRDPIEEGGGVNLYAYTANSPMNLGDAWGTANGYWHWDRDRGAWVWVTQLPPVIVIGHLPPEPHIGPGDISHGGHHGGGADGLGDGPGDSDEPPGLADKTKTPCGAFLGSLGDDAMASMRQLVAPPWEKAAQMAQQAIADYEAGGFGNALNRYNFTRGIAEAAFGVSTMAGEDESLSATERWSRGLVSGGQTLLAAAGGFSATRASVASRQTSPIAGRITGYTRHGINQAISREGVGVSPEAILDAVRNPTGVIQQADGALQYVGKDATVILNKDGKVITTYARSSKGCRN